ncbi:hypothetical protein QBC33DRAFT_311357 [Phialemonium atrogriseum]|uniref:Uncharacterized protein n=1 Tax=Phialemonium atrogriseum TaxID=1093897 RepID=A0AAJ0FIY8_9PEZI|nr:uncharacterized protein QBC33DRAFT_311357 [Phialemonium atrogriseum]KAK1770081.1 hypothetical protein QBC33DRAFT_311357 [Phialemonium atrogriseum]
MGGVHHCGPVLFVPFKPLAPSQFLLFLSPLHHHQSLESSLLFFPSLPSHPHILIFSIFSPHPPACCDFKKHPFACFLLSCPALDLCVLCSKTTHSPPSPGRSRPVIHSTRSLPLELARLGSSDPLPRRTSRTRIRRILYCFCGSLYGYLHAVCSIWKQESLACGNQLLPCCIPLLPKISNAFAAAPVFTFDEFPQSLPSSPINTG